MGNKTSPTTIYYKIITKVVGKVFCVRVCNSSLVLAYQALYCNMKE